MLSLSLGGTNPPKNVARNNGHSCRARQLVKDFSARIPPALFALMDQLPGIYSGEKKYQGAGGGGRNCASELAQLTVLANSIILLFA